MVFSRESGRTLSFHTHSADQLTDYSADYLQILLENVRISDYLSLEVDDFEVGKTRPELVEGEVDLVRHHLFQGLEEGKPLPLRPHFFVDVVDGGNHLHLLFYFLEDDHILGRGNVHGLAVFGLYSHYFSPN